MLFKHLYNLIPELLRNASCFIIIIIIIIVFEKEKEKRSNY